jgi:beta-glucanase (GH16 family)
MRIAWRAAVASLLACGTSGDGGGAAADAAPEASLGAPADASIDAADDGGSAADADDGAAPSPAPRGPTGAFTLIFDDEFSGSSLDPTKWNSGWYTKGVDASSPPVQAGELEYYAPSSIVFPGDGAVHLRLATAGSNPYGKSYVSGMIQSSNLFTFDPTSKPVVLEASIRVAGPQASAKGYWPAFWLLSNLDAAGGTGQWPPEIDVFEFFGNANAAIAHLHTTGGDINHAETDSTGVDLSLALHAYTIEISPQAITFWLDGTQKWSYTDTAHIAGLLGFPPLYVLICFQLGGAGGGPLDGQTQIPNDMVIDYVRAWSRP